MDNVVDETIVQKESEITGSTVKFSNETSVTQNSSDPSEMSNRTAGISLLIIFISSLICLAIVFNNFPDMTEEDKERFHFPTDIEGAKDLGRVLSKYKNSHYYTVLGGIIVTYIFLQTFAIPGSISLSILSGFLYPFTLAITLVCFCSAIGATFCYLLSSMVGHGLVNRWFPERLKSWKRQVARHQADILNYIIFLRITPILPNWFINLASPVIGVKILPFFFGTFIGVAPPSFLFIRAGTTLYELTTTTGHISLLSILILTFLAILSLLPVALRKWLRRKVE